MARGRCLPGAATSWQPSNSRLPTVQLWHSRYYLVINLKHKYFSWFQASNRNRNLDLNSLLQPYYSIAAIVIKDSLQSIYFSWYGIPKILVLQLPKSCQNLFYIIKTAVRTYVCLSMNKVTRRPHSMVWSMCTTTTWTSIFKKKGQK